MYLYRLGEYIVENTTPTLCMVSFENVIDLNTISALPMAELEHIWKEKKQIVFMLPYVEKKTVYYFLLPTNHADTFAYWHHDTNNQHRKWHHCDFYATPILNRCIEQLEQRLENTVALMTS